MVGVADGVACWTVGVPDGVDREGVDPDGGSPGDTGPCEGVAEDGVV